MIVKKIEGICPDDMQAMDKAFAETAPHEIACCNWEKDFPYAPEVTFRMFHTGDLLMLHFEVTEKYTAALVREDNGMVWTDSCVEFFVSPDDGKTYYNFETTCIGRMLLAHHLSREEAEYATPEILASVRRIPSLPQRNFEEVVGHNRWSMTLCIPPTALFRHGLSSWNGARVKANLYKCGDNLTCPHFLSWRPITIAKPDFHRPDFFDKLVFE